MHAVVDMSKELIRSLNKGTETAGVYSNHDPESAIFSRSLMYISADSRKVSAEADTAGYMLARGRGSAGIREADRAALDRFVADRVGREVIMVVKYVSDFELPGDFGFHENGSSAVPGKARGGRISTPHPF